MIRLLLAAPVSLLLLLTGCGNDSDSQGTAAPTDTPATDSGPSDVEESVVTLASGESVHYHCLGDGQPGILLESGSGRGGEFGPSFVDPLAGQSRVCTYDRLGTGASDPAPDHKRTPDDLCDVEDEVRASMGLGEPAVLVGQSAGANLVIWCASRRPDAVAGLVSIEGYHDDPAELAAEFGEDGWRGGSERIDWAGGAEMLDSMPMPIGTFPVLVISATDADQGGVDNQKYWLALSPRSRQVVLHGGHDLHFEVPDQVAAEILKALPGA